MRNVCTYFDRRYLVRGLTLYRSLAARVEDLTFWVLCLDDYTKKALDRLSWPGIRPVALAELEQTDPELAGSKHTRSTLDYYFTSTPAWLAYVLAHLDQDADCLAYADADLLFYASPALLDAELDGASILLTGHRFAADLAHLECYGRYNVGFMVFRRDEIAVRAAQRWRRQCIEWCHDRVENDRFGDQKYLDEWPELFSGVREVTHLGAGLAPWNYAGYELVLYNEELHVDGEPLVFFHFHGLRLFLDGLWYDPGNFPKGSHLQWLYGGYLRQLRETRGLIRPVIGRQHLGASLRHGSWAGYAAGLLRRAYQQGVPILRAWP